MGGTSHTSPLSHGVYVERQKSGGFLKWLCAPPLTLGFSFSCSAQCKIKNNFPREVMCLVPTSLNSDVHVVLSSNVLIPPSLWSVLEMAVISMNFMKAMASTVAAL